MTDNEILIASQPKWISVKDELPKIGSSALWYDGKETIDNKVKYYIDFIDTNGECRLNYVHNYTHWMPMPEPPKESE